ncbi:hypothetical protein BJV74DRAFT_948605 [Russula compacta]|nr:hypothetical protein BJV74DRAFT_948605 [Russula compacta]
MIFHPLPRNTTVDTPTSGSPSNNATSSSITDNTRKPPLTHGNLVGVLIIAALLALGLALWLCFGKWSKPIRHFLRGEPRSDGAIDDGAPKEQVSKKESGPPGNANSDPEKEAAMAESSSSEQSSLDHVDSEKAKANVELALSAKALHAFTIKSGSQLARLGR